MTEQWDPAPGEFNPDPIVAGLRTLMFQTWQEAMKAHGYDVTDWTQAEETTEAVINPLGAVMDLREAVFALHRIKDMAGCDLGAVADVFGLRLPSEMEREGSPSLVVWAVWNGDVVRGEARAGMPKTASILLGILGEPEEAQWTDPLKVYRLLELGYLIGSYNPERATMQTVTFVSGSTVSDEEIPF